MSLGLLLLGAAAGLTAALFASRRTPRLWLGLTLSGAGLALLAAILVLATGTAGEWRTSIPVAGDTLHLRCDGLSAFFLALAAVVGGAGEPAWAGMPAPAPLAKLSLVRLVLAVGLVAAAATPSTRRKPCWNRSSRRSAAGCCRLPPSPAASSTDGCRRICFTLSSGWPDWLYWW